jgi:hypothetical protein|tara:strand:+ start:470 stop:625 length:156 start_codon:yes stop_codon:yes gene_type:complete
MRNLWSTWAKALGSKEGHDKQADKVAIIRTIIVLTNFVTCLFIIANALHHW